MQQQHSTDEQLFFCPDQPVLIAGEVIGAPYATILRCDVIRAGFGTREGTAWIMNRPAVVSQRYPGYDPSYEWVFDQWADVS